MGSSKGKITIFCAFFFLEGFGLWLSFVQWALTVAEI